MLSKKQIRPLAAAGGFHSIVYHMWEKFEVKPNKVAIFCLVQLLAGLSPAAWQSLNSWGLGMDPASCEILEKELDNLSKTEKSISGTVFPIMPSIFFTVLLQGLRNSKCLCWRSNPVPGFSKPFQSKHYSGSFGLLTKWRRKKLKPDKPYLLR